MGSGEWRADPAPAAPGEAAAEPAADAGPAQGHNNAPFALAMDAVPVSVMGLPAVIATTAAVLGASTSTVLILLPGWRAALVRLAKKIGALLLFSRIAQEDILNHERRSDLLEYVRNNPGERVEVARRMLGFSNGSMHYHLRVLQDRNLVRILKEGSLARLYPAGPKIHPSPYVPAERRRFLDTLAASPGVTQRQLAQTLGLSERMVSYHVQTLSEQGLVDVRPDGSRKRLFPANASYQGTLGLVVAN
jgi:predicted transcriptional regulator